MRIELNSPIYTTGLADALQAALGVKVAITVRQPGQADRDGHPLPGVLILTDPITGEELTGLDEAEIRGVLASNQPPAPVPSPVDVLVAALTASESLEELKVALIAYANALAAGQQDNNNRQLKVREMRARRLAR